MSKKTRSQIKEVRKAIKDEHNQYVNNKIDQMFENPIQRQMNFDKSRKLRLYDYFIIVTLALLMIGLSFIISIFIIKDINMVSWVTSAFTLICLFSAIVTGWLKNNLVAKFFNDKRRRYQTTMTEEEGLFRRIIKIILFTSLILLIISIIFIFTFK
ncbi:hypothetical protein SCORR_v1c04150 [Spiroplasma corruscae]|uniref:Transmembrane protein n=1 Tax=Spiroplasma corruscae TaxID=216934 RepID=A0A222ENV7_9MOLU|nr:hypothetical protein [Spiroplasma corruscae]ASP28189.1 hypothetical protein SCORR_v1c04150 [Spiroplasma corruscae]